MALSPPLRVLTSGTYNLSFADEGIVIDASSAVTVILPPNSPNGKRLSLSRVDSSWNVSVQINPAPNTIRNQTSYLPLMPGATVELMSYNFNWIVTGGSLSALQYAIPIPGSSVKVYCYTPVPRVFNGQTSINLFENTTDNPLNASALNQFIVNYGRTIRCVVSGIIRAAAAGNITFTASITPITGTYTYQHTGIVITGSVPVSLEWKFYNGTINNSAIGSSGLLTVLIQEPTGSRTVLRAPTGGSWAAGIAVSVLGTITSTTAMDFTLKSSEIYIE